MTQELEKLSAVKLRWLVDRGLTTVVVPFGSIEHHGGHLPVGTDALLADAIGHQIATRLGAVLGPTQRVGDAELHRDLDGTLTLDCRTLTDVAVALTRSLARQGFRVIVLLSTHGGNHLALQAAAEQLWGQLPNEALVCAPRGDVGQAPGRHSGAWITSVMLEVHPELVDLDAAEPSLAKELASATAEQGRCNLERFAASVVRNVNDAATR